MTPQRVQMTRKKGGWRSDHPDAVIVARPGRFGNPFPITDHLDGRTPGHARATVVDMFCDCITRGPAAKSWPTDPGTQEHLRRIIDTVHELRGRDLACWCPLDQPCHADVLLEAANR